MKRPADHDSDKAARILAVTRDLVLRRGVKGVTVAEIAEKAHVGKGTAYLYWATKEDLLIDLFAREFLEVLEADIAALSADPDLARPQRFCPRLIRNAVERPFMRALQANDGDLLGVLAGHPRTKELLVHVGPAALMYTVLPVWREHRLARADWALDAQAYALRAVMAGFLDSATSGGAPGGITVADADAVMAATVTALLGGERASAADVHATAAEGLRLLREKREILLSLLAVKRE
ncbi:TetR/AcrR family transcriptional regulator [Nonomuraea ceibae]|uniref:TetR/AcrR family transcriptional regulator n=1 Tax=Nonomuraea ceibae TaxID=1935170 RepID=UPI001C5E330F|nr:TetR/AcrR family transcriptional regulator [Nonomuraea ceibae]